MDASGVLALPDPLPASSLGTATENTQPLRSRLAETVAATAATARRKEGNRVLELDPAGRRRAGVMRLSSGWGCVLWF
ncbi:hypothetical protein GCM10027405_21180 [Arthrobacter alkaliphilus]